MEIFRAQVKAPAAPEPENREEEIATVQRIMDACERADFDPTDDPLIPFGRLTAWVAMQLSLAALHTAKQGQAAPAVKLGAASLRAAKEARADQQFYSNLLDWANVLIIFEQVEEAKEVYQEIINSPLPAAEHAKSAAHVSLGSIYRLQYETQPDKTGEVLFHIERGLRYVEVAISQKERTVLLAQLVPLYATVNDAAGLAHCMKQLGQGDAEALLLKHYGPDTAIDRMVALTARLRALDEPDLAEAVFRAWQAPKPASH